MTATPAEEATRLAFSYAVLDRIADEAERSLVALWLLRSQIPQEEVTGLVVSRLTALILWAETVGWSFGDGDFDFPVAGLPAFLLPDVPTTYRPVPDDFEPRVSVAPDPDEDTDVSALEERLTKALRTIEAEPAPQEKVERLVRDEAVQAAQRGYQDGIRARILAIPDEQLKPAPKPEKAPEVTGYRRGTNPDCCELCFWLWKEGYVYPISQPMHRHTGCRCWPVPTTDKVGRHELSDDDEERLADYMDRFDNQKETQDA